MNEKHVESTPFLRLGILLLILSFFAVGCELGSLSSSETTEQGAISLAELNGQSQPVATTPTSESSSEDSDSETESAPAESSTPAPSSSSSGSGFLWQPGANSVKVVIPASLPHWQFHVFSRRKHNVLYGPDNRGGNKEQTVTYTLSGSGATWRKKSQDSGDDGSLLIFINTRDPGLGDGRNSGWRIMDPTKTQSGDGDRIQPGEDR